jgi:hypothetical protein
MCDKCQLHGPIGSDLRDARKSIFSPLGIDRQRSGYLRAPTGLRRRPFRVTRFLNDHSAFLLLIIVFPSCTWLWRRPRARLGVVPDGDDIRQLRGALAGRVRLPEVRAGRREDGGPTRRSPRLLRGADRCAIGGGRPVVGRPRQGTGLVRRDERQWASGTPPGGVGGAGRRSPGGAPSLPPGTGVARRGRRQAPPGAVGGARAGGAGAGPSVSSVRVRYHIACVHAARTTDSTSAPT